MIPLPHGIAWSAGDARAVWIGAVGGSIAGVALVLALAVTLVTWMSSFGPDVRIDVVTTYATIVTMWVLPIVVLVALPTTGYLAASGAVTRPGRSGVVAAGAGGLVMFIVCAALSTVLYGRSGRLASFLGTSALLSVLAVGLVMLGVAFGVRR